MEQQKDLTEIFLTTNIVYDIFCKFPSAKNFKNHNHKIGKIENYQILFYGTCKKCKK
ncbi:MAG: hypothetical protein UR60_C0024G0011 [Candidatus Moranbacteria bacterium GW2011_GWF2_34_56]|nr:MAG: hypothetical protein UR60_C0024G0011 [Candidatus Moranbacteria bacterium GW2011_GWF2_34_56]